MRVILLDLGNTLVNEANQPLPGARALLESLQAMKDSEGKPIRFGLVSDYNLGATPAERQALREAYLAELRQSGLDGFFQPFDKRITLSTDMGVFKPERPIFEAAVRGLGGHDLHDALFVTENQEHVEGARALGMTAFQIGQEVPTLADLLPLLRKALRFPSAKKHDRAAGRHDSQTNKSKKADDDVLTLVSQVDPDQLRRHIQDLSAFPTRWSFADNHEEICGWLETRFVQSGYDSGDVRRQAFTLSEGLSPRQNVLCGPSDPQSEKILICAHYDSISEKAASLAPGADDNASGIAVMLEAARLLRTRALKRGVLFAAFGGEEQGLIGSSHCADLAAQEHWNIDVVINIDMVAFQDPANPHRIRVEYDQGNANPQNDAAAKAFALMMAQAAADYTNLAVEHTNIYDSDYMPFEEKGYACIGIYEGGENPNYHRTGDTLQQLDMGHLAEICKMLLATVYALAR